MSAEETKNFVRCFINFLHTQIREEKFSSDAVESIEVAAQCLEAAFELHTGDGEESLVVDGATSGGQNSEIQQPNISTLCGLDRVDIFGLYKIACVDKDPDRQHQAEDVKNEGNSLMKDGKFSEALNCYNKAISLDATNPVFYCNRAAAFLRLNEFDKSIADCKMAILYNPRYSKAYGRLGIAYSNLQRYDDAMEAYTKALELDPTNQDYQNNMRVCQESAASHQTARNILNSVASQAGLAGAGNASAGTAAGSIGAGGGGGQNPNLDAIGQSFNRYISDIFPMNNPEIRNLVQEMLADPMIAMASRQVVQQMVGQYPDIRDHLSTIVSQAARQDSNSAQTNSDDQQDATGGGGGEKSDENNPSSEGGGGSS